MRGNGSKPEDYLFHKGDWFACQQEWKQQLVAKIESANGDELLNTSTIDLAKFYASEYEVDIPEIFPDEIVVDQRETQVDVSQDRNRMIRDRSRPFIIVGTSVDVELPYHGSKVCFDIQPTTYGSSKPRAYVDSDALRFSIVDANLTQDQVRSEIERRVKLVKDYLAWLENDVRQYNLTLEDLARETIERRKDKLLKDRSLVAGLGFKIKVRPGASETFAAPSVRRRIRPATPKPIASRAPFVPEPTLTEDDYEHILKVLENMVTVMEMSPGAFREIDEESLRTHFLVHLNGHFSGNATGETFNYEGKTDILIKADGRNIFIGECKFWSGEKAYLDTLDQVLSYLSWRDTKAAVLVFSRNREFTSVLEKIAAITTTHQNCKRLVRKRSDSSWMYLFGHKDDANREISITVQAFNVPERIEPRTRSSGR
jgi:hypothetical protein